MALSVPSPQKRLIAVLAALAVLVIFISWSGSAGHHWSGSATTTLTACPAQDELKSFLSARAAGMRQWNAFREIYSFEVEGYQKNAGSYTISFNQGYVNCVKDGPASFKCDRRDPILSISSGQHAGGVLVAHEITVDAASFGIVGRIMCARGQDG